MEVGATSACSPSPRRSRRSRRSAALPVEAALPPAYLDLAGVPAIVSPPNMRRVASEPYEPLLLDADVLRTAGPIHPLVIDDVLPVALVQTTP